MKKTREKEKETEKDRRRRKEEGGGGREGGAGEEGNRQRPGDLALLTLWSCLPCPPLFSLFPHFHLGRGQAE